MDNNNKSASPPPAEREEEQAATAISLLKALEDMLHNNIKQKKEKVHKTKNIADTDRNME